MTVSHEGNWKENVLRYIPRTIDLRDLRSNLAINVYLHQWSLSHWLPLKDILLWWDARGDPSLYLVTDARCRVYDAVGAAEEVLEERTDQASSRRLGWGDAPGDEPDLSQGEVNHPTPPATTPYPHLIILDGNVKGHRPAPPISAIYRSIPTRPILGDRRASNKILIIHHEGRLLPPLWGSVGVAARCARPASTQMIPLLFSLHIRKYFRWHFGWIRLNVRENSVESGAARCWSPDVVRGRSLEQQDVGHQTLSGGGVWSSKMLVTRRCQGAESGAARCWSPDVVRGRSLEQLSKMLVTRRCQGAESGAARCWSPDVVRGRSLEQHSKMLVTRRCQGAESGAARCWSPDVVRGRSLEQHSKMLVTRRCQGAESGAAL